MYFDLNRIIYFNIFFTKYLSLGSKIYGIFLTLVKIVYCLVLMLDLIYQIYLFYHIKCLCNFVLNLILDSQCIFIFLNELGMCCWTYLISSLYVYADNLAFYKVEFS